MAVTRYRVIRVPGILFAALGLVVRLEPMMAANPVVPMGEAK
jgi:hypothetical protein